MCQQYGSHLLTIQNFHEASAIAALIKNYQVNENIWIRLEKPSKVLLNHLPKRCLYIHIYMCIYLYIFNICILF